ncbi:hypothetical protein MTR67_026667 [Solanum verrucosum]|uniref:Complex 1 LYR protein domain-containing protein n=1 Tax=Solanum verrucosum TaxID=315347 RepID=A0AAF0QZD2_SOLVR|nr:hypothetical protein MTR67_026667 [Solanum verrucosum]
MESGMALSLEDFLVRARVLKLYRHALRISRRAPPHARGEAYTWKSEPISCCLIRADLRQIIRQEMENNRNCNDKQRIRFLISDGIERVKRLDETLDMQGH